MTVNADLRALMGFSAGNHILGSLTKEAGVTVTSNVATCDTTQAHRWSPQGQHNFAPTPPTGYTKLATVDEFVLQRSGTAGADHKILGWEGLGGNAADCIKITESTAGVWSFYVAGVFVGTYTPANSTDYHIAIWCTGRGAGGTSYLSAWDTGWQVWVTVLIDKVVIFNQEIIATGPGNPRYGVPIFGEGAALGGANSAVFKVSHYGGGYSDRANPIGKITAAQWTLRLGQTPPAGYDDGTSKTPSADAAADVDETPPAGSGTTDVDYFDLTNNGTPAEQLCALAQNILAAGDVLYAVASKVWERTATSGKVAGVGTMLYDGTNRANIGLDAQTGPTSYAEDLAGDAGIAIWNNAPDGAAWSGKANAYLNGCWAGCYVSTLNTSANNRIDAQVIETAVVKSGDAISALADPTALVLATPSPALMGLAAGII